MPIPKKDPCVYAVWFRTKNILKVGKPDFGIYYAERNAWNRLAQKTGGIWQNELPDGDAIWSARGGLREEQFFHGYLGFRFPTPYIFNENLSKSRASEWYDTEGFSRNQIISILYEIHGLMPSAVYPDSRMSVRTNGVTIP